jgi:hypothetical protein
MRRQAASRIQAGQFGSRSDCSIGELACLVLESTGYCFSERLRSTSGFISKHGQANVPKPYMDETGFNLASWLSPRQHP